MKEIHHVPVLVDQVLRLLDLGPGMTVADLTVGTGGHAQVLAEKIGEGGLLYAVDQDEEALRIAEERLRNAPCRVVFIHANFRHLRTFIPERALDACLADLGLSSLQVDSPGRGFSFRHEGPLDMRMDPASSGWTAADAVNRLPEERLAEILRTYGEEPFARRIAREIVARRSKKPLTTTGDLVDAVWAAMPPGRRRRHPARRTFQALRIFVNDELAALEEMLSVLPRCLKPGGRCAVISFHSLEDRIVKRTFAHPPWSPLTKKPIVPSAHEVERNPRARPAKLRAAVLGRFEGE